MLGCSNLVTNVFGFIITCLTTFIRSDSVREQILTFFSLLYDQSTLYRALANYNHCPAIQPDQACLLHNGRGLFRICAGTNVFFSTGSKSDNDGVDPSVGFAHVVNGAKKGPVPREGSGGSGGPIPATDAENLNWLVDSDLHSSFVRVKLVLQDITKIPRNHLR